MTYISHKSRPSLVEGREKNNRQSPFWPVSFFTAQLKNINTSGGGCSFVATT